MDWIEILFDNMRKEIDKIMDDNKNMMKKVYNRHLKEEKEKEK